MAALENRVFPEPRLRYMRSIAEDVEQDARMALDLRDRHTREQAMGRDEAVLRERERNDSVEAYELALVRDSAFLFATVVKHADPAVLTEQLCKVLTEAELDSLRFALAVVQSSLVSVPPSPR